MSEESVKLNDEIINNKLSNNKEITISSYQDEKNKIENSLNIDINNSDIPLNYGKYKIISYNSKGDPLLVIGPDYSYFLCLLLINLLYFAFLSTLFIYISNFYVASIGILLLIIQLSFLILSGIKNPGLPKREMQNEILLINEPNKYVRCHMCNFIVDKSKRYIHCNTCKCCCEGYDHHCPWTSKCVGRGNIFFFHGMLILVCIVFIYIIFAIVVMDPKK